jgi:hypothetical protein
MHNCKWLFAAGLVAGTFVAYQSRPELQQWVRSRQFRFEGFEQVPASAIYPLETNRWLEFDIPEDTPLARVISNGAISSSEPNVPGTEWPYAIEYQMRGSRGRTTGIYHFKGERTLFLDKQSGKPAEVNSFLDRHFTPLSGRQWMLNLRDPALADARVLRLRLQSSDPNLLMVAVRVYFRAAVPERKIAYLWDRISDDQKSDLARGNVYSFEGLSAEEIFCVLRYHWQVASPSGIPGRDFDRQSIYVRDDSEQLQEVKDWVPAGLAVDAGHFGVLPITNAASACQIRFVDYASTAVPQVVSNTLWWHGERQEQTETNFFAWSGTLKTNLVPNRDGLLQISSSRPVFVRAFQADQGQTNEITPEPDHLLTFTCSPTNFVDYDVDHAGNGFTLFRLDLRRAVLPTANTAAATPSIRYTLFAESGDPLHSGEVLLTNAFSPYDWLITNTGLANITLPQSLCFILPPAVRALRVASPSETALVNAYSRPSELVKRVRVPEDYSPAGALMPAQPSWFTVRPHNHLQRREAGLTSIVQIQTRPTEDDPRVLAGEYEWDSFLPATDARGQMILLPPMDNLPPRPDSLSFSYAPVAVGGDQRVRFQAQPWLTQVEPSLMLVFTNSSSGPATVSVDGQTLFDGRLDAPVTAVRLGNLAVGEHTLNISATNSVVAFLNYLATATNAAYFQRYCTMASSNTLSFPYTKRQADAEVLVLKIFSPATTNPQPFEVRLNLKAAKPRGLGPFPEITFLEREAQVTPNADRHTWLVANATAQLDDGQPVFFPIDEDLPPGDYQVEVRVTAASPRWLSLSRTTPGVAEKLKLTLQQKLF